MIYILDDNFTLTVVKTTAVWVPRLRVAMQTIVTIRTAMMAVIWIAHWGIASGGASLTVACQNNRFKYSAKIRLITAFEPDRAKFVSEYPDSNVSRKYLAWEQRWLSTQTNTRQEGRKSKQDTLVHLHSKEWLSPARQNYLHLSMPVNQIIAILLGLRQRFGYCLRPRLEMNYSISG